MGWTEILIIVLILLLVFGTTRIPQLGEAIGKGIKNFQKALKGESTEKGDNKNKESENKKN